MSHIITKIILTSLVLVSPHIYADDYDFKPGLWKTTSTVKIIEVDAPPTIEKMIRGKSDIPVISKTVCVKNLTSLFDSEVYDIEECKTSMKRISSNKVSVEVLCSDDDGAAKTIGEINLNGKTMTSWFEVTTTDNIVRMKMKIVGSGEHIGVCQ